MSAQALLRVGDPHNMYYADSDNCKKQAINVEYNTRFKQDLANKSQGTSVITVNPNQGYTHFLLVLGWNASSINNQNGQTALKKGWGYDALNSITFRVAGSSQYQLSSAQLLQRNLRMCRTQSQRQAILDLGGNECKVATDFDTAQFAYIPISIFNPPATDDLNLPLPTNTLSQLVLLTVQLNAPSSYWFVASGAASPVAPPQAFDVGYVRMEQLEMKNRGDAIANRVNLNENMLVLPNIFDQQEIVVPLGAQGNQATTDIALTLTGFRAAECKSINVWLQDGNLENSATTAPQAYLWVQPTKVEVLYAGTIYSQYENGEGDMWNLLDGTSPSAVTSSALTSAAGAWTSAPVLFKWLKLPFSQPSGSDYSSENLIHGKTIDSGLVNLNLRVPYASTGWVLHAVYELNSTIGFSKGTAEFYF